MDFIASSRTSASASGFTEEELVALTVRLVGLTIAAAVIPVLGDFKAICGRRGVWPWRAAAESRAKDFGPWLGLVLFPSNALELVGMATAALGGGGGLNLLQRRPKATAKNAASAHLEDQAIQSAAALLASVGLAMLVSGAAEWAILAGPLFAVVAHAVDWLFPWHCLTAEGTWILAAAGLGASPRFVLITLRVLLFRLMISFAKTKFFASSPRDVMYLRSFLSAMPMPNPFAIAAARLGERGVIPRAVFVAGYAFYFLAEVVAPPVLLFAWSPLWRFVSAASIAKLMIGIAATGCFAVFPLMTIALAVPAAFTLSTPGVSPSSEIDLFAVGPQGGLDLVLLVHMGIGLCMLPAVSWVAMAWPTWSVVSGLFGTRLATVAAALTNWRVIHAYGVFPPHTFPATRLIPVFQVCADPTAADAKWHDLPYRNQPTHAHHRGAFVWPFTRHDFLDWAAFYPVGFSGGGGMLHTTACAATCAARNHDVRTIERVAALLAGGAEEGQRGADRSEVVRLFDESAAEVYHQALLSGRPVSVQVKKSTAPPTTTNTKKSAPDDGEYVSVPTGPSTFRVRVVARHLISPHAFNVDDADVVRTASSGSAAATPANTDPAATWVVVDGGVLVHPMGPGHAVGGAQSPLPKGMPPASRFSPVRDLAWGNPEHRLFRTLAVRRHERRRRQQQEANGDAQRRAQPLRVDQKLAREGFAARVAAVTDSAVAAADALQAIDKALGARLRAVVDDIVTPRKGGAGTRPGQAAALKCGLGLRQELLASDGIDFDRDVAAPLLDIAHALDIAAERGSAPLPTSCLEPGGAAHARHIAALAAAACWACRIVGVYPDPVLYAGRPAINQSSLPGLMLGIQGKYDSGKDNGTEAPAPSPVTWVGAALFTMLHGPSLRVEAAILRTLDVMGLVHVSAEVPPVLLHVPLPGALWFFSRWVFPFMPEGAHPVSEGADVSAATEKGDQGEVMLAPAFEWCAKELCWRGGQMDAIALQ